MIGAQICAILANIWGKRRYQPEDFVPIMRRHKRAAKQLSAEESVAWMKGVLGGGIDRGNGSAGDRQDAEDAGAEDPAEGLAAGDA
jgi:hypothetical protein